MIERQTSLYRYRDAKGRLLYVGISGKLARRLHQHESGTRPWVHEATNITVEHFDTRAEALAAESEAIATEDPVYNIAGKPKPAPAPPVIVTVEFTCTTCGQPIDTNDEGYLQVVQDLGNKRLRNELREQIRMRKADASGPIAFEPMDLWLAMPPKDKWQVIHARCDPNPDDSPWFFSVSRLRHPGALFDTIAHLTAKGWVLDETDFIDLVRRIDDDTSPIRLTATQ